MKIGAREVGPGHPVFIVAELGINHDGSVEKALAMVRAAKEAGADAVKVQCFSADCFLAPGSCSWHGEDQHAMFKRYELPREAIKAIADECRRVGLVFFGTPDCLMHARWLVEAGAPVLKVGSDDLINTPLIRDLAAFGLPLILSTGMASRADVRRAEEAVAFAWREEGWRTQTEMGITEGQEYNEATKSWQWKAGNPGFIWPTWSWLMCHCVSSYPTPSERANIRRGYELFRDPYDSVLPEWGYSDHTDGPAAAPLAVALGACLIEKHFTLDRSLPGPDHAFSADPAIFAEMVRRIREAEVLLGSGDCEPSDEEKAMRPVARRSIVAAHHLRRGVTLAEACLAYKRPGTGLMPYEQDKLLGKILTRDVAKDEQIRLEDVT